MSHEWKKMDKTETTPNATSALGTVPMARIDGAEIRRLRESKGLTQLYLATFIGVTTDTISRWENRRYPSIKLDNAEKLAQALEVTLQAILDQQQTDTPPAPAPRPMEMAGPPPPSEPAPPLVEPAAPAPAAEPPPRPLLPWLLPLVLLLVLGGLALWRMKPAPTGSIVAAARILPDHVPPGQTFPVLLRVSTSQQAPMALILKETIPPGCRLVAAEPTLTSVDGKSGVLKWVSRTDRQVTTFAYLVRAPAKGDDGDQLRFSGGVTLKQGDEGTTEISGAASTVIAPYHWADGNRDNKIDDEEILAIYDRYSALGELDFDRDLIDGIWAGNGYGWDRKTRTYVVRK